MKKRKLSGERNEFFKYFMRNAAGLNWGRRGKHKVPIDFNRSISFGLQFPWISGAKKEVQ